MQKELKKNTTFDHLFLNNNQISIDGLIIYTDNDQWKLDFNINVNNEENQIWSTLFNNTMDIAKKYASKEFNQGHKILQLNSNKIPNFDQISTKINKLTNWSLQPVAGFIDEHIFFKLNSQKKFPSTTLIRLSKKIIDKYNGIKITNTTGYTPEPDIFHDIFGHAPFLTNPQFCDFLADIGCLGIEIIKNDRGYPLELVEHNIKRLQNFVWWSYEFGLLKKQTTTSSENDIDYEIYGAGILSSENEIENIVNCAKKVSDHSKFLPFDIEEMALTRFDYSTIQNRYFVADNMEHVYDTFNQNKDVFFYSN